MSDPARMLADILLPGDAGWPRASEAIPPDALVAALGTATGISALADTVAALGPGAGQSAVAAFEEAEPASFRAYLGALTDAYYTSAAVAPLIAQLAEACPDDPASSFAPDLLAGVIARQSGRRRL